MSYNTLWEGKKAHYDWCVPGSEDGEQGGHYYAANPLCWQPLPDWPSNLSPAFQAKVNPEK
nr:hypothetical protein [uncultured Arsenicibacter sp.]